MRRSTPCPISLGRRLPDDLWNAFAFALDSSLFTVGMSLLGSTTILPTFIASLTDSPLAVGLAGGITSSAWLLPQLVVAGAVAGVKQKKPIIVRAAWLGRSIFLLVALIVWLFGSTAPAFTAAFVLLSIAVFFVLDSVVSVPWFDLLARAIPVRRRGRILGLAQVVGGLGGIVAGVGVRYILSEQSPWKFPQNHAVIFAATSISLMLAAIGLTLIKEPPLEQEDDAPVPPLKQVLKGLPGLIRADCIYQRLIIVRILAGWVAIASAFYVLHAHDVGGLAPRDTGLLVSAQVFGSLAAGLLLGVVQDRLGPLMHIRLIIVMAGLPAAIALAVAPLLPALGEAALYPYLVIFFFLGLATSGLGWPFFNYVLEHAPDDQRPLYIGALNTFAAIVMLAPPLGGWILRTFSYTPVFVLAVLFAASALVISLGLPSTRLPRETIESALSQEQRLEPS